MTNACYHTYPTDGVPQQFLTANIQRLAWNSAMHAYNFEARVSNHTKLFHMTCHKAGMTISVQLLGAHAPEILEGKKTLKFRVISDNFRFWSWISPVKQVITSNTPTLGKIICSDCQLSEVLCCKSIFAAQRIFFVWTFQESVFHFNIFLFVICNVSFSTFVF